MRFITSLFIGLILQQAVHATASDGLDYYNDVAHYAWSRSDGDWGCYASRKTGKIIQGTARSPLVCCTGHQKTVTSYVVGDSPSGKYCYASNSAGGVTPGAMPSQDVCCPYISYWR